jgi:predicted dehydrogenase
MREPLNFDALLHIDTAYEDELRGLLDAIEQDTAVPLPPEEARQAVLLSVAAVWSSQRGQVAHIQPDFNTLETAEGGAA